MCILVKDFPRSVYSRCQTNHIVKLDHIRVDCLCLETRKNSPPPSRRCCSVTVRSSFSCYQCHVVLVAYIIVIDVVCLRMSKALKAISSKVDFSRHLYRGLLIMIALCLTERRSEWKPQDLNCILCRPSHNRDQHRNKQKNSRRFPFAPRHRRCSRMYQISLDRPLPPTTRHEKSQLFSSCLFFFLSRISHQQPL